MLEEFKFIYWMEYAHRMWGRVLGLVFAGKPCLLWPGCHNGVHAGCMKAKLCVPYSCLGQPNALTGYSAGPAVYFVARGMINSALAKRLGLLFLMGGTQGLVGWWMVKSGLEVSLWIGIIWQHYTVSPEHYTMLFVWLPSIALLHVGDIVTNPKEDCVLRQAVLLAWTSRHLCDSCRLHSILSWRLSAACLRLMLPAGACGGVGHAPCEPLSPGSPPDLSRVHLWPAGLDFLDLAAPLLTSRKGSWLLNGSRGCQAAWSGLPAHCTHHADRSFRWNALALTAFHGVLAAISCLLEALEGVLLPDS